ERGAHGKEAIVVADRPEPDGEFLLGAGATVLRRRGVAALLAEVLDVRVVAVVQPAVLSQALHETAVHLPVLAESAAGDGERGPVGIVVREPVWQAHGDGRRVGILLYEEKAGPVRLRLRD